MELLQNRALCWMQKKASAKTCPAAIWQGDIPLGDFRLMGVDGAVAEREENFIHLQLGQHDFPERRDAGRRAENAGNGHLHRTARSQPNLMDLLCQLNREFCQRPGKPAGLRLKRAVILVHFYFPFPDGFGFLVLLSSLYGGRLAFRTATKKQPHGGALSTVRLLARFDLNFNFPAWQGTRLLSGRSPPGIAPWSVWNRLPHPLRHKKSFWKQSRWPCRRSSR